MNCKEVQGNLPHYLANEVSASMRKLILAHLTGCENCRKSLEQSAALQQGLRRSLHTATHAVTPSDNAWERLAPQLTFEPQIRQKPNPLKQWIEKGLNLMKKPAFAALALIIVLISAAALVPPVRAQMQSAVAGWFGFEDSHGYLEYNTNWGFAPYTPAFIPDDLRLTSTMTAGEDTTEAFGMLYSSDTSDRFAALIQTVITTGSLPQGRSLQVKGRSARMQTGDQIDLKNQPDGKRDWIADRLDDKGVRRLTFNLGEVQIDVISNLPEAEMLRMAEQLTLAPSGTAAPKK